MVGKGYYFIKMHYISNGIKHWEVTSIAFTEICQRLIHQWPLVFKQQMESWEHNQIWAFCFHIPVMVLIHKNVNKSLW